MALPQKGDLLSGRYEIIELLGEGGMGRVYRARDRTEGIDVAVKVLSDPSSTPDPGRLRRFEREIDALKRINHPEILRYLDHGRDGELSYLVIELLSGRSLDESASEFLHQTGRILLLGARFARALGAAHEQGIIHRDIKPSNLFITNQGEPRILDYGLARWVVPEGGAAESETMERLTATNALVGTVPYMSPEQLRVETLDRRTDIFSLAVVLYLLASGRRPYEGASYDDLLASMEAGDPPPLASFNTEFAMGAGLALNAVLRRALRPVPHERFHSMAEFAEALEQVRRGAGALSAEAGRALLLPPPGDPADREIRTLFGRGEDLALLEENLQGTEPGRGVVLVVEGASGIGKSLLLAELVRTSHRRGWFCLTASTPAPGSELDADPVAVWLRRAAEAFPTATDFAGILRRSPETAPAPGPDFEAAGSSPREDRILAAFTGLAGRLPLLLLLEDVHHASSGLMSLLEKIAALAAGNRLALILSRRTDAPASEAAEAGLASLLQAPATVRLSLEPLGAGDLRAMVEEIYPGLRLSDGFVRELVRTSGGNPSFAQSVLRVLESQGALARSSFGWHMEEPRAIPSPPEAVAVLEARLARLESGAVALLEASAVLGVHFQASRVCEMLGLDTERGEQSLRAIAKRTSIIFRDREGYRFDQPTTHEALLGRLPRERREALHRRAAETLAHRASESADPRLEAIVVSHFLAAGNSSEAAPHAVRAGLLLAKISAWRDAVPALEQARSLLEIEIEAGAEEDRARMERQLTDVDLALGESLHALARNAAALEKLESARARAAAGGRVDLQARSLVFMSDIFRSRGDMPKAERRAEDAQRLCHGTALSAERALALSAGAFARSRAGDDSGAEERYVEAAALLEASGYTHDAAEVHFRLGNHHFRFERLDRAEECYARAESRLNPTENPRLFAGVLNGRGAVLLGHGRPAEALPAFQQAAAIRRSIGARSDEASSQSNIANCHHRLGNLQEAARIYAQVIATRREIGETSRAADTRRNHAEVLLDLGRLEEALAEIAEAVATKRELEDLGYLPLCLNLLASIELDLGRLQKAREVFKEVLREYQDRPQESFGARLGLARVETLTGHNDLARKLFEEVASRLEDCADPFDAWQGRYRALQFHLARRSGPDVIRRLAGPAVEETADSALPEDKIHIVLIRSILSLNEGRRADARSQLREALEMSRTLGTVERTWRIHRDLSRLEPEGSEPYGEEIRQAMALVEAQIRSFRDPTLARAYAAHPERADLLQRGGSQTRV